MPINWLIKSIRAACLFFCILFISSCSNTGNNKSNLHLGFMPNVTHATALVGIEKNFFRDELGKDTDFKPIHFIVGNSIIDAFITNQIDAAYVGPGPYINAVYRNIPIQFLSNAANGGTLLVGTTKLPLPDGARIAVPQYGNTQDLILRSYLKKNNLLDKVKIIALPPQDTGTAFFTMSIDAACLPEPWGTILIEKRIRASHDLPLQILVNEKSILNNGEYPVTVLIVNKKFAQEHPDLTRKLLVAHNKSNAFISNNPSEAIEITRESISRISKKDIKVDIIAASFKRCQFKNNLDLNILKEFKTIAIIAGYYRKGFQGKASENNIN